MHNTKSTRKEGRFAEFEVCTNAIYGNNSSGSSRYAEQTQQDSSTAQSSRQETSYAIVLSHFMGHQKA